MQASGTPVVVLPHVQFAVGESVLCQPPKRVCTAALWASGQVADHLTLGRRRLREGEALRQHLVSTGSIEEGVPVLGLRRDEAEPMTNISENTINIEDDQFRHRDTVVGPSNRGL